MTRCEVCVFVPTILSCVDEGEETYGKTKEGEEEEERDGRCEMTWECVYMCVIIFFLR